jgi:hypothetical protein
MRSNGVFLAQERKRDNVMPPKPRLRTFKASNKIQLLLDDRFKKLNDPLSAIATDMLQTEILRDGCLHPLVAWKRDDGSHVLIDGYSRHAICEAHGIPYQVEIMRFDSEADAVNWAVELQIGRRNLSSNQQAMLLNRRVEIVKGGRPRADENIAKSVAESNGVSSRTVERAQEFVKAVQTVSDVAGQAAVDAIMGNGAKTSKTDVVALAKLPAQEIKRVAAAVGNGVKLNEAIKATNGAVKPAAKGRPHKPAATKITPKATETEPQPEPTKKTGKGGSIYAANQAEVRSLLAAIREIERRAEDFGNKPEGAYLSLPRLLHDLRSAEAQVSGSKLYDDCPECSGKGCSRCKNTGAITKAIASQLRQPN